MSRRHPFLFLFITSLILSACGGSQTAEDVFEISSCSASKIESQFVVEWKDGRVTVEKAKDKQAFFDEFLNENANDVLHAEHNHRVVVAPPANNSPDANNKLETFASPVNWGVDKIEAAPVWNHAQGSGITVAVIDSGAEVSHFQLSGQLHQNPGEVAGNGIDDDGNGKIDDVNGWDFVADSGNVTEVLVGDSHGTHVAGIIAAAHSGDGLIKGVAPQAKILPLNFMDASRGGTIGHAIEAIDYAVAQGAKVINASWGSAGCSSILENKVAALADQNVLFVAAAGNSGNNISTSPEFPAAYQSSHQITVGASTTFDLRPGFSNFSSSLVQLLAPGFEIISTVAFDDGRSSKSGTSMAAPFVSGAAAVLWSSKPSATPSEIRSAILNSVDPTHQAASGDTSSGGRLNLRKAYNLLNGTNI